MKRARTKKHSFLLLELMVALALVSTCAIPLVRTPFLYMRRQTLALEEIQLHLESEKALGFIKEKFYRNEIAWKDLDSGQKKPLVLSEDSLDLPNLGASYHRTCRIKSVQIKDGKNEEIWAKVILEINFTQPRSKKKEKKFFHTLALCQKEIPLEPQEVH
jgi:hypothetical protein